MVGYLRLMQHRWQEPPVRLGPTEAPNPKNQAPGKLQTSSFNLRPSRRVSRCGQSQATALRSSPMRDRASSLRKWSSLRCVKMGDKRRRESKIEIRDSVRTIHESRITNHEILYPISIPAN